MSVGRIHYLAYALWIGAVTLALLTLVGILPRAPFWPTLGVVFYAVGAGILVIHYVLTVRRRRGLEEVT